MFLKKNLFSKTTAILSLALALAVLTPGMAAVTTYAAEEEEKDAAEEGEEAAKEGEEAVEGEEGEETAENPDGAESTPLEEQSQLTEEEATQGLVPEETEVSTSDEEQGETTDRDTIADQITTRRTTFADEAIMQIQIGYEFDDGSFDEWARGSAFLIGNRYLMTSQLLVDTSVRSTLYERELAQRGDAYRRTGINLADEVESEAHIRFRVIDTAGNTKKVESHIVRNGMGIVILQQPESTATGVFADVETINTLEGTIVGVKFAGQGDSKCLVQSVQGIINPKDENIAGFTVTADTSLGNPIGAPILNENGNVIGMVSGNGEYLTVFTADALQTFLSSNGITFKTESIVAREQRAADDERARLEAMAAQADVVYKDDLKAAITAAQAIDKTLYTNKSVGSLEEAIRNGQIALADEEATQAVVDEALGAITVAQEGLRQLNIFQKIGVFGFLMIILVVLAIAAVIFVFAKKENRAGIGATINGFLKNAGKKGDKKRSQKEDKKKAKKSNVIVEEDDDDDMRDELARMDEEDMKRLAKEEKKQAAKEKSAKKTPVLRPKNAADDNDDEDLMDETVRTVPENKVDRNAKLPGIVYAEDADEEGSTSELTSTDDNSEGTTVLSKEKEPVIATLTRIDDGSEITIMDGFVIGKEKKKVDYCILNNSAISRVHAFFRVKDGEFYIEDNKSTNYTFVNGAQIPDHRAVYLSDGSTIRLADVEFEFRKAS